MLVGRENINEISGRFLGIKYETTVTKDNKSQTFLNIMYATSFQTAQSAINEWNRLSVGRCAMYSYKMIGSLTSKRQSALDIYLNYVSRGKILYFDELRYILM